MAQFRIRKSFLDIFVVRTRVVREVGSSNPRTDKSYTALNGCRRFNNICIPQGAAVVLPWRYVAKIGYATT